MGSTDSNEKRHRGTWRSLQIIDPVQQLGAPPGPLADLAFEAGARLRRVVQNLANALPAGGVG